jgi:hypothetical protein
MFMHIFLIFGGYILYNCGFIQSENRFFVNGEAVVDDKIYTLGPLTKNLFSDWIKPQLYKI